MSKEEDWNKRLKNLGFGDQEPEKTIDPGSVGIREPHHPPSATHNPRKDDRVLVMFNTIMDRLDAIEAKLKALTEEVQGLSRPQ